MASFKDLEKELFQLPLHDQAILARNLIRSLENEDVDKKAEMQWFTDVVN